MTNVEISDLQQAASGREAYMKKVDTTINKNNMHYGDMVLPDGSRISLDDRRTRRNNNVLVVGAPGTAKTRSFVIPNLLELEGSYIITDPKGNLCSKYGEYMRQKGYSVKRLSFIHPEESVHYHPLTYVSTTQDIQKLSYMIIGSQAAFSRDPYWERMGLVLLNSVIGFLKEHYSSHPEQQTIANVLHLLRRSVKKDDNDLNAPTPFQKSMEKHREYHPDSWAAKQFESVDGAPPKTFDSIVTTAISGMNVFETEELTEMMKTNEIDFGSIGREKTAVFVEASDTDRSMDMLINLFFSQAMNELCHYADEKCPDHRLPVPVRFIMDDFATNCRIDHFDKILSNIRSRKISAVLVLQSLRQLESLYGADAATIVDDCDTLIYMGGNDPATAQSIALRCDKTASTILHMEVGSSWIVRQGEAPYHCRNFELDDYIKAKAAGRQLHTAKEAEPGPESC